MIVSIDGEASLPSVGRGRCAVRGWGVDGLARGGARVRFEGKSCSKGFEGARLQPMWRGHASIREQEGLRYVVGLCGRPTLQGELSKQGRRSLLCFH